MLGITYYASFATCSFFNHLDPLEPLIQLRIWSSSFPVSERHRYALVETANRSVCLPLAGKYNELSCTVRISLFPFVMSSGGFNLRRPIMLWKERIYLTKRYVLLSTNAAPSSSWIQHVMRYCFSSHRLK